MRWILVFCLLFSQVFAVQEFDFEIQGMQRRYLVNAPKSSQPMPLVVVLHWWGGNAEAAAEQLQWVGKSDKERFIVAFGEAMPMDVKMPSNLKSNPNVWNNGLENGQTQADDIAYLKYVINDLSQRFSVDPNRIYVTGFSSGGSMAFRAGIELSDLIAAIAPVSGRLLIKDLKPARLMSVLLITGSADPLNPLEGLATKNPQGKSLERAPMIDSIKAWLPLLGLDESQQTVKKKRGLTITTWGPNPKSLEAIFVVVEGLGHQWPGAGNVVPASFAGNNVRFFNATDFIWDFFKTQSIK
jgi:polyhydroxybutyrate depolymerase